MTTMGNPATSYSRDAATHTDKARCGNCGHSRSHHEGGRNTDGACTCVDPDGRRCPCKHGVPPRGTK